MLQHCDIVACCMSIIKVLQCFDVYAIIYSRIFLENALFSVKFNKSELHKTFNCAHCHVHGNSSFIVQIEFSIYCLISTKVPFLFKICKLCSSAVDM